MVIRIYGKTFEALPDDLNATIIAENDEFEVAVLEGDEIWSFVGNKNNNQWQWLVMPPQHGRFWHFMWVNEIKLQERP